MGLFERVFRSIKGTEDTMPVDKPGRNETCWCGSGKKYKKCHLSEDQKKTDKVCSLNCGPT